MLLETMVAFTEVSKFVMRVWVMREINSETKPMPCAATVGFPGPLLYQKSRSWVGGKKAIRERLSGPHAPIKYSKDSHSSSVNK